MVMFIFTLVLMASLGAMLYLMAQALPRVADAPEAEHDADPGASRGAWARSHVPEKIDAALNGFLVKFLRKIRVATLKIDNAVSGHLAKVKPDAGAKKPAIDFKEIAEQNKEGAGGGSEKTG